MFNLLIISLFLSATASGAELLPKLPEGWVEMNSIDPVIVTWVKAEPEKKFEETTSIMVQNYKFEGKIKDFVEKETKDQNGCFVLNSHGWKQTWCKRSEEVFAILSRGDAVHEEGKLKAWVLSHD